MKSKYRILGTRLYDFFVKSLYYSPVFAFYDLVWWFCFYIHPPFAWKLSTYAIEKKTKWLDKYVGNHYADIIERFNDVQSDNVITEYKIWVFWGQGESEMPPLVRACYSQLTASNDNVILVTNENVSNYISLSKEIYSKVNEGHIQWANFSDIVRTTLLAQYGGLWLDATVWVSGKIPFDKLNKHVLFSANGTVPVANRSVRFWSSFDWNWSSWCMFANVKNHQLFGFVSEMLQAIAIREKIWPDYVIQDYLIFYACRNFHEVKVDIENNAHIKCKNRNRLAELMNVPYDEKTYQELIQSDFVFKLSFRSSYQIKTQDGRQTFYGKLISKIV